MLIRSFPAVPLMVRPTRLFAIVTTGFLLMIVLFFVLLLTGVPVAVALGLGSAAALWWFDMPLAVIAQRIVNSLDSTTLLAVPMFILAAALFNVTGLTAQLFDFIRMVIGRMRGGLGQVSVLSSLFFGGVSGSAIADVSAVGGSGTYAAWTIGLSAPAQSSAALLSTSSYADPAWLTSLSASKLTGTVLVAGGGTGGTTGVEARANLDVPSRSGVGATGTWGISISGSAASASTATTATVAGTANALNTAGNYQVGSLGLGTTASGITGEIRAGLVVGAVGDVSVIRVVAGSRVVRFRTGGAARCAAWRALQLAEGAMQPGGEGVERLGLVLEQRGEGLFGALADALDGGHRQFALAAGKVVVEAALGRAGLRQQFIQANAMQALALQGVGHGVDQFVAGRGLFHGLNI